MTDEYDLTAAVAEAQIRRRIRREGLDKRNPDYMERNETLCPECGAKWDIEHDRCTANCQTIDKD